VFVLHLFSFQSLVIEVAVAVLLLVSLLFILLRSFGRGALWIALLVLFSLFLHLLSTRVWGSLFRRFPGDWDRYSQRFAPLDYFAHAGKGLGQGRDPFIVLLLHTFCSVTVRIGVSFLLFVLVLS
jgi:hypothetical protein